MAALMGSAVTPPARDVSAAVRELFSLYIEIVILKLTLELALFTATLSQVTVM